MVITEYPVPQSITQLHQFLRLANYYHKFVMQALQNPFISLREVWYVCSDIRMPGVLPSAKKCLNYYTYAYYCRQLSKVEKNYSTTEREILAVITVVKEFYPYLYGCIL